jgi:lipid A 4'-phosphatase
MNRVFLSIYLSVTILLAGFFILYPEIDIWVSEQFFKHETGFYLHKNPILSWMYYVIYYVTGLLIVTLLILLIISFRTSNHVLFLVRRQLIYLSLAFLLGPGLLVNVILKNNWGRARPIEIVNFMGEHSFTPAFLISEACARDCSFVSGHAAMGFLPMALGFCFLGRKRYVIFTIGILTGIMFGGARVLQGSHFISDVIFSALLTFLLYYLLSVVIRPVSSEERTKTRSQNFE